MQNWTQPDERAPKRQSGIAHEEEILSKKKKRKRPNLPEVTLRRYGPGGRSEDAARVRTRDDFDPDYSHVVNDLKRIGVLAVSLISILIVLSFFLG